MCQSATLGRGPFITLEDHQVSGGPKTVVHRVDDFPAAVDICLGCESLGTAHRAQSHGAARDEPGQIPLHLLPDLLCKSTFHKEVYDHLVPSAAPARAACGGVETSVVHKGSSRCLLISLGDEAFCQMKLTVCSGTHLTGSPLSFSLRASRTLRADHCLIALWSRVFF